MKIFKVVKEDEGCDKINPALMAMRLELTASIPDYSGLTISP
jgi:hypothetical protein